MTAVPLQIFDEFYETVAQRVASHVAAILDRPAEWLTVPQVAAYLRTSEDGIRALVKRGRIPHHRAAGRILFERAEIDDWVRSDAE
jgi:excisionase family DNA binding protein